MRVSLIENAVFRFPKGMEGWRNYRIEYGGHAESCVREGSIWVPPTVDPALIEAILQEKMIHYDLAEIKPR